MAAAATFRKFLASVGAQTVATAFALLAAVTSAAGAWLYAKEWGPLIGGGLVALSLLFVLYERNAVSWISARRARKQHGAARWGVALLIGMALYTALMQITYLGSLILAPMSSDAAQAVRIEDLKKRVAELDKRRTWLPQTVGTVDGLREEIKGLEAQAADKRASMRDQARRAADELIVKRKELSIAETQRQLDIDLPKAQAELAAAIARPPSDAKGQVLSFLLPVSGAAINYLMVLAAVCLIQAAQILLPAVTGRSEVIAARAASAVLVAEPVEPPKPLPEPPKPTAVALLPPPATVSIQPPKLGPLALAALEAQKKREAAEAEAKAKPARKAKTAKAK